MTIQYNPIHQSLPISYHMQEFYIGDSGTNKAQKHLYHAFTVIHNATSAITAPRAAAAA
jgi:hypothetical protein